MAERYSFVLSGVSRSASRPSGIVVSCYLLMVIFLLGKYKGTLLVAISCDADNTLVALAFALVERENKDSWAWFLRLV
jgi:hypothetical protein